MNRDIAAIYARFSSDNQRDESIDAQLRACNKYAEENALLVTHIYEDRAKTGTNDDRPDFQRMIKDAKANKFSVLIIHKLDRFSRSKYDSVYYKRELKIAGVRLISVCEQLGDSPEDGLLEAVMEGVNQWYSANLSREVMKGMLENAYNCKHTGGKPPLGYDVDPQTKKYIVNEREAEAVRLIFQLFINGAGYDKIIDALNDRGYKTKQGNNFSKNSIHDLLGNEKYIGTYVFNRAESKNFIGKRNNRQAKSSESIIRTPGGMPAIVDEDTFARVADKLRNNKRQPGSYKAKELYLLSGLVVCGECLKNGLSRKMVGNRIYAGRNKNLYVTYRCGNRDRTKQCNNLDIRREYLEEYVLTELADTFFNEENIKSMVAHVNQYVLDSCEQLNREYASAQNELAVTTKQMQHIADAIANGFAHEMMLNKFKGLEQIQATLVSRIHQIEADRQQKTVTEDTLQQLIVAAKPHLIKMDSPELRSFVKEYVRRVIVYQERVEVEFQFPDVVLSGGGEGNRTPVQKSPPCK